MIKNKVTKPLTLLASALCGLTLAVFVTASGCARYQGDITPERLRCEYLENPMGIDIVEPGLSWEVRTTDTKVRGLRQSAYQIQVASSPELLAAGKPDLWDSDKVDSDETVGIVYAGKKLSSRDRCHWRVRVWPAPSGVLISYHI